MYMCNVFVNMYQQPVHCPLPEALPGVPGRQRTMENFALLNRVRCRVTAQLVMEVIGLILTISTVRDGHAHVSLPAAFLGLFGCTVVICHCMSLRATYSVILATNTTASCLTISHIVYVIIKAATIE